MRSKIFIILLILFVLANFWFVHCRDSYLLSKARLITISSAIRNYQIDNGDFPCFDNQIENLLKNYLAVIPDDPYAKSNKIVKSYEGTGGWVYDTDDYLLKINSVKWWNPYTWGNRLVIKLNNRPENTK